MASSDPDFAAVDAVGCDDEFLGSEAEAMIATCRPVLDNKRFTAKQRAFAYFAISRALYYGGRDQEALSAINGSIDLNPNFAEAYARRGFIYGGISKERAVENLRKAMSMGYTRGSVEDMLPSFRQECPALVYRDNVCEPGAPTSPAAGQQTATATPATPAAPSAAPAGQEERFVIGPSSKFPALTSTEMLPALKPGDEVKITPYTGPPNAGDVVAFKHPSDGTTVVARRLIGLPGDEVVLRAGVVSLNEVALARAQVDTAGATAYRETLPNGTQYVVLDDRPDGPFDDAGPFKVPAGHYFVLADHRDQSLDSRSMSRFGYIPAANIVGRVDKTSAPAPPLAPPTPVAATPQPKPDSPDEKPGWLSWLWGGKKPAVEPPPPASSVTAASPPATPPPPPISPKQTTQAPPAGAPAAAPSTLTTTKADYLGKEVEVVLPSQFCLADTDDAIIARVVELKAKDFPVLMLAGFKDCDVAKGSFRNRYGIAFGYNDPRLTTPDATVRENMRTAVAGMCADLKASSAGSGFPVGELSTLGPDAAQVEAINAHAGAMLQGPHEAAIRNLGPLGLRNDVCYSAELWMTSDGKARKAMFGVLAFMLIKERPVILAVYEQILNTDTARQLTDRVATAADRMRELNGAGR